MAKLKAGTPKPAQKKDHRRLFGFLFLVFGVIVFLKLMQYDVPYVQEIPDHILLWLTGIGSGVGGLFMLYKSFTRRKYFI